MKNLNIYSASVLRIGIALVFLWFGWSQIHNTNEWIGFVPQWVGDISRLSSTTIVHLNGLFEIVFGSALLLGLFTRFVAFFLTLHMIDITYIVGLNAVGVRDFGLAVAVVAVWMNGVDVWSLDGFVREGEKIQ